MRRSVFGLLLFAFALWLGTTAASGQAKKNPPVDEWVETADGVKLHAQFYETNTPKKGSTAASSPVVLLLYSPGVGRDMNKGNWGDLLDLLNADGFHVFQFDWRGHGKSVDIVPKDFWNNRYTGDLNKKLIVNKGKKAPGNTINVADFDVKYFPVYVEDLAAVRVHLDQKNDKNFLNTSSIYIIGAEDTVQLGFLCLAAEWLRPAVHPMLPNGAIYQAVPTANIANKPEGGKDIAGMIWLSPKKPTNGPLTQQSLQAWLKGTPGIQDSNPMLFIYGQQDTLGTQVAESLIQLLGAGPMAPSAAQQLTFARPIKGTKLQGVALLGQNQQLGTETMILEYLRSLEKNRGRPASKNRNYVSPYFVDLVPFRLNF